MILAEFETRKFSFKCFASNAEQAETLMRKAWDKHREQYPTAETWEALADKEYFSDPRITEVTCGTVLRDHSVIHDEPVYCEELLEVATVSHRHGFNTYVGRAESGAVQKALLEYVEESWQEIEAFDAPAIETVLPEERVDVYFKHANEGTSEYLEVNETYMMLRGNEHEE